MKLKDGGSIKFQALLYNITKYHKLDESAENGYEDFELSVKKSDKIAKTKILDNQELDKNNSDFDLYYVIIH